MKSICVFLGSNSGNHPSYLEAADQLGRELATRNITCVYGGSCTGLMNQLANSALNAGGNVIGVTVQALKDKEEFHKGITELHVMPTMHERKKLMVELSDAFIALPGGVGTFEEFFEVYTLKQLGFHSKPCGIVNVNNFYSPVDELLNKAEEEGFLKEPHEDAIVRSQDPVELIDLILKKMANP